MSSAPSVSASVDRQGDPHRSRIDDCGVPAVRLGQGLHDGKTEARASVSPGAVPPGEAVEGATGHLLREARTLVGHVDRQHP